MLPNPKFCSKPNLFTNIGLLKNEYRLKVNTDSNVNITSCKCKKEKVVYEHDSNSVNCTSQYVLLLRTNNNKMHKSILFLQTFEMGIDVLHNWKKQVIFCSCLRNSTEHILGCKSITRRRKLLNMKKACKQNDQFLIYES